MKTSISDILVRIPTRGNLPSASVAALLAIQKRYPALDIGLVKGGLSVSHVRHKIVKEFLEGSWTYLIMIDDDVPAIPRIIQLPDWNKDIVGGVYPGIKNEVLPYPHLYYLDREAMVVDLVNPKAVQWGKRMLIGKYEGKEILIGGGLMCIHRRVLEHPDMKKPFLMAFDDNGVILHTDDITFCIRALDAGFETYADLSCWGDHVGQISLGRISKQVQKLYEQIMEEKENVGPNGS